MRTEEASWLRAAGRKAGECLGVGGTGTKDTSHPPLIRLKIVPRADLARPGKEEPNAPPFSLSTPAGGPLNYASARV